MKITYRFTYFYGTRVYSLSVCECLCTQHQQARPASGSARSAHHTPHHHQRHHRVEKVNVKIAPYALTDRRTKPKGQNLFKRTDFTPCRDLYRPPLAAPSAAASSHHPPVSPETPTDPHVTLRLARTRPTHGPNELSFNPTRCRTRGRWSRSRTPRTRRSGRGGAWRRPSRAGSPWGSGAGRGRA